MNTNAITRLVVRALEDMKGADIQVIDVTGLTAVTDHLVICTGTSSRHVKSLAGEIVDKALEAKVRPLSAQGLEQGDWALVDLNGVVVHVMLATTRATYQLEKLWDLGQARPTLEELAPARPVRGRRSAKPAALTKPNAPAKPARSVAGAGARRGGRTPVAKADDGGAPATVGALNKKAATTAAKPRRKPTKATPATGAGRAAPSRTVTAAAPLGEPAPRRRTAAGVKVQKSVEARSNPERRAAPVPRRKSKTAAAAPVSPAKVTSARKPARSRTQP